MCSTHLASPELTFVTSVEEPLSRGEEGCMLASRESNQNQEKEST